MGGLRFHTLFCKSSPKDMFIDLGGGEKNIDVREKHPSVASCTHPDWGICNVGRCPDQELNPQPVGVQSDAPTN